MPTTTPPRTEPKPLIVIVEDEAELVELPVAAEPFSFDLGGSSSSSPPSDDEDKEEVEEDSASGTICTDTLKERS
jgi:hypothetical protein